MEPKNKVGNNRGMLSHLLANVEKNLRKYAGECGLSDEDLERLARYVEQDFSTCKRLAGIFDDGIYHDKESSNDWTHLVLSVAKIMGRTISVEEFHGGAMVLGRIVKLYRPFVDLETVELLGWK